MKELSLQSSRFDILPAAEYLTDAAPLHALNAERGVDSKVGRRLSASFVTDPNQKMVGALGLLEGHDAASFLSARGSSERVWSEVVTEMHGGGPAVSRQSPSPSARVASKLASKSTNTPRPKR